MWIIIILIIILVAYLVYRGIFYTCCALKPLTIKTQEAGDNGPDRATRLADPNLLYHSSFFAAFCSNKGKPGACDAEDYLYSDGKVVEITGFAPAGVEKMTYSTAERKMDALTLKKFKEQVQDSRIMNKNCPGDMIEDAVLSYQINMGGVKKSFQNPTNECKNVFDGLDDIISTVKP